MIIPVEEAREILGDESKSMSDDEIELLIYDLDIIAQYSLKQAWQKHLLDADSKNKTE